MRIAVNICYLEQHRNYLIEELRLANEIKELLKLHIHETLVCDGDSTLFYQQLQFIESAQAYIELRQDALAKAEELLQNAKENLEGWINDMREGMHHAV